VKEAEPLLHWLRLETSHAAAVIACVRHRNVMNREEGATVALESDASPRPVNTTTLSVVVIVEVARYMHVVITEFVVDLVNDS